MDLRQALADLSDPCIERNKRHSLEDILILTVCAFVCDANTWVDVETFGAATHRHWGIENHLHWSLDVTFRETTAGFARITG